MDVPGMGPEFYSPGSTYHCDVLVLGTAQEALSKGQGA